MKSKKNKIESLKVVSFLTTLHEDHKTKLKGGVFPECYASVNELGVCL